MTSRPTARLRTMTINGQPVEMPMNAWVDVYQQIATWIAEDLHEEQESQRATGMIWHAVYWSHHERYERECFSLHEAESYLRNGSDAGDLYDEGIRLPDGTLVPTYRGKIPE